MKKMIKNCLATSALAILLLAVIALFYGGRFLCIETVFQIAFSSVIIHLALALVKHFESNYFLIEVLVEVGTVLIILLSLGVWFRWFDSLPVWILILMGITVYIIGCMIDLFHIHNDIRYINTCLMDKKL